MTFKEQARALVAQMTLAEKMEQLRYDAPAIERLGVPAYNWWNECLHGVARSGAATVFPQAIGMASSFDTALMEKVGDVIATEARAKYNEYVKFGDTEIYQGLNFFTPNINIFRDPRWGRGHETYGEDPYLTGRMGAAFVSGLQGTGKSKYRKADATLKHYAVHSGPEPLRHGFDAVVGDKDLYETYLEAFRYVIEHAKPASVMGAYNRVNGEVCCASPRLMHVLYEEFGFDGYFMSDAGALADFHHHHKVTKDAAESAAMALNGHCHLGLGDVYRSLPEAYERGLITEEVITEAAERLFEARYALGMFSEDCEYHKIPYDVIECEEHLALSRKMAEKSTVLLKNDGLLPLDAKKLKTVAVIGPNADAIDVLLANYNGTPSRYTTLLQGIQKAGDANGFRVLYARGCNPFRPLSPWSEHPNREAIIAAKKADAVILCMGLNPTMEGEQCDSYSGSNGGDKKDLSLPAVQLELIEKVLAVGKPTVFVNVSGSAIDLSCAAGANAILQCFYPGAAGGDALADILFGKVSPSGRLPVTFYRSADDLPPFEDYSMENRTYKFFKGTPLYEFGHGLTYSEISENWLDEDTVELENKGDYDTDYSVLKFTYIPHKNLADFKCVHLHKGERITVSFS